MKKVFFFVFFALSVSTSNAQIFLNDSGSPANYYEGDIWRTGSVAVNAFGKGGAQETGFTLFNNFSDIDADWGGSWYGFQRGNSSKLNLCTEKNAGDAVMMNGFWGIGMRTASGKFAMAQNGVVMIGEMPKATIRTISERNSWDNPYKLYVADGIRTEKIKVDLQTAWGDYVFKKDYCLLPLSMVEKKIQTEGHLPDMPSAETLQKDGLDLGDMSAKQQVKIEEAFLHLIEMDKRLKALEAENAKLKTELDNLKR